MTEQEYLNVLHSITNAIGEREQAVKDAYSNGRATAEQQIAMDSPVPPDLLALLARVLSNVERLTIAQEVIAGIRNKNLLNVQS